MIKLSIIVAIYNIENYIEKCLESLINQKLDNIEIICVNDGSTDNSLNIIKEYASKDNRIKIINKTNGGISSARNAGIKIAKGEYIYIIDGDDYIKENTCEKLINILNQGNVDVLVTGYYRKDWNNKIYEVYPKLENTVIYKDDIKNNFIPSILGVSLENLYKWFKGTSINENNESPNVWRFLYSNKIIKENYIKFKEDLSFGEDILFNFEYLYHCENLKIFNDCFYYYVWRNGSLSQRYNKKIEIYEAKTKLLDEKNKINEFLIENYNEDYSEYYQGSTILSLIQMAMILSDCDIRSFMTYYSLFKKYSNNKWVRSSYRKLKLKNSPIKYKIPLLLGKYNCKILIFIICFWLNKFNYKVSVD